MQYVILGEDELTDKFRDVPPALIKRMQEHLIGFNQNNQAIEESIKNTVDDIDESMPPEKLFLLGYIYLGLIEILYVPYQIASEKYNWAFFLPEYQVYNIDADKNIRNLKALLVKVYSLKEQSRGLIDTGYNAKKQNEALEKSRKFILQKLDEYEYKDSIFVSNFREVFSEMPISMLKKHMTLSGLNYIDQDRKQYVFFEQVILAPFRFRKIKDEGKYDSNQLKSIIDNVQTYMKKFPHIGNIDIENLISEKKCLDSLSRVQKNQAFGYLGMLFHEYYDVEYESLRDFYKIFFTDTYESKKTSFMKKSYEYMKITSKGNLHYLEIDLPCPFGIIE